MTLFFRLNDGMKISTIFPGVGARLIIINFIKYCRHLTILESLSENEEKVTTACLQEIEKSDICIEEFQLKRRNYEAMLNLYFEDYSLCMIITVISAGIFLVLYLLIVKLSLI